ncbi:TPA: anthranilate phosphoribosyltransferase [Candidatus Peregrinibacteria bacterium]|nr:anthranilate phosphoribosyltransferase [Candidatus Peregrinibacteria bacterium]HIQ57778.1 anthranilate phosphoribosyltransferase [Candidatus Gracilibacteria bacterium]
MQSPIVSNYKSSHTLFTEIFENKKTQEEISNILTELTLENLQKNKTYSENFVEIVAGAADAMREHAVPVHCDKETFDVCGTGGSGNSKPFNISTTSSLIIASQNVCVAKHGNRAASSKSGSADVLEALQLNLAQTPPEMSESLKNNNMAFLFAQVLHPAMKYIMPIRKEIGVPTIFNIMGPLTNPSNPTRQVTGVSKREFVLPMAQILQKLGRKSAIVLFGEDGLDDATICGKTYFAQFTEEKPEIEQGYFSPEQFGFLPRIASEIKGGKDTTENAEIMLNILNGRHTGAKRDIVLFNAGIAFYISRKTGSIEEGIALAEKAIITGDALKLLQKLQK